MTQDRRSDVAGSGRRSSSDERASYGLPRFWRRPLRYRRQDGLSSGEGRCRPRRTRPPEWPAAREKVRTYWRARTRMRGRARIPEHGAPARTSSSLSVSAIPRTLCQPQGLWIMRSSCRRLMLLASTNSGRYIRTEMISDTRRSSTMV